jgi:hypothetical protein
MERLRRIVTNRGGVLLAVVGLAVTGAAQPPLPPNEVTLRPLPPGVDPTIASQIAEVVRVANAAYLKAFAPVVLGKPVADRLAGGIELVITPARIGWHENVVTDRSSTIYVRLGPLGIGQVARADAGPVALMCEAVADLHNTRRLPGFNRFVAHRFLVPAVVAELGNEPIDIPHPTSLAPDGMEMLRTITSRKYTPVHPDIAACAALMAVEEKVGLETFHDLVDAIPEGAEDPFAVFREYALGHDTTLAQAFAPYDEALRLEPDETGSCLVASFEPDETIVVDSPQPLRTADETLHLRVSPQDQWSLSDEWSTDGTYSLKLEADETARWMAVYIVDPDWKFRDFRRFSTLEMDFVVQAADPQPVTIALFDHPTDGHGGASVFEKAVPPGEERHVSFALTKESLHGGKDMDASYFDGTFRVDSVSRLYIGLGRPRGPVTLYLDNLRLRPREPVAPPVEGLPAGAVVPTVLTRAVGPAADPGKAEQHYQEGLALKQAGRLAEAHAALRAALEADPNHVDAHWARAWVLIELGDRDGAKSEFRKVLELAPTGDKAADAQAALERLNEQ